MKKYLKAISIPLVAVICISLSVINFTQAADEVDIQTQTADIPTDQQVEADTINQSQADGDGGQLYHPQTASVPESVQLKLNDVGQFQTDGWSCGVHSAYRILKGGYNQSVDYNQMKDFIGIFNVHYHQDVVPGLITIDIDLNKEIGRPTSELIGYLKVYRGSATVNSSASNERIKDLLREGKPVMVLVQVGSGGGKIYDEWFLGVHYYVNTNSPLLHWYVAVGYDSNYIYLKDTVDNITRSKSWSEFQKQRAWEFAPYNQDIANAIQNHGAHPGDIIYFDEPLPSYILSPIIQFLLD